MSNDDPSAAFIGCATVLAVIGVSLCGALGLLWVAVRVVAHAWGAQ